MRILKNPVLKEGKIITIVMLIISAFSLFISMFSLSLDFTESGPIVAFSFNKLASVISIIPLSYGVCTALLIKTRKSIFARIPAYIISCIIAVAFILYFIGAADGDVATIFILFTVVILLIYPFIIAVLTLEGRVVTNFFAVGISSVLIFLSTAAFIVISIYLKSITITFLLPALVYTELLLSVLCFRLEDLPKEKKENYQSII